jgi:hypothetical protein
MYKVCIYNSTTETIIHYPTSDNEAPHINALPLEEQLSSVGSLSFNLYTNNPGYNSIYELITKVKVINVQDDSIKFSGRVLQVQDHMDSSGLFYKEVVCEDALSYLNDSKQRHDVFMNLSPYEFVSQLLAKHNSQTEPSKHIMVGDINVTGFISYITNYKTTLSEILSIKDELGGDIRIRESSGILYLDWLTDINQDIIVIKLGENMKDMVKKKDITGLGTRIIPLGKDNLTITSVNGGVDYIDDTEAIAIYGIIEKIVEYSDIDDASALRAKCLLDLKNHTQPKFVIESSAIDLHYLSGININRFTLGATAHIINPVMNADLKYRIVRIQLDLLAAYNPNVTISDFPTRLTNTVNRIERDIEDNQLETEQAMNDLSTETDIKLDDLSTELSTKIDESVYQLRTETTTKVNDLVTKTDNIIADVDAVTGDLGVFKVQTDTMLATKVATEMFTSYQTQTADLIASKVSSSTFESYQMQTDNTIASKVSSNAFESYRMQTDNRIAMVVDSYGSVNGSSIVMGINESSYVKIAADKLELDGLVTINSLSNGTTSIDGGCITAKSLAIDNLCGNNIDFDNGGYINALPGALRFGYGPGYLYIDMDGFTFYSNGTAIFDVSPAICRWMGRNITTS